MFYDYTPAGYLLSRPKSEIQFWTQSFASGFDPTGIYSGYLSARDNTAYMRDYLKHTGMDWGTLSILLVLSDFLVDHLQAVWSI